MEPKHALVTGATGVVGRNLLRYLATLPDWRVTAVSRRDPGIGAKVRHIAVDLSNRDVCTARLGALTDVTHVFHAAYSEQPTAQQMCSVNRAMFANVLDAVEPIANRLQHIHVMQGTKYYGSHLGPFKTPAKEEDPRVDAPIFYYDLQDLVVARQRGRPWTWSAARPHAVIGFALGNPMNLSTVVAVYATINKALGMPLSFPGDTDAYRVLYQCTDADLLARAMVWMATTPACANQAFNITNGDLIRWQNVWPRLSAFFDMPLAPPRSIKLVQEMADKGPVWDALVVKHGLKPHLYAEIASWAYGDSVFATDYDIISDVGKARRLGFCDAVDTEQRFLDLFATYRSERIIP